MMINALRIVLSIPLVAAVLCLWFVHPSKIKRSWFAYAVAYGAVYIAVFHYWLKAI